MHAPRKLRRRETTRSRRQPRARAAWLLTSIALPFALAVVVPQLGRLAIALAADGDAAGEAVPKAAALARTPASARSRAQRRTEDFAAAAPSGPVTVFRVPIEGIVDLGMAPFVERVVHEAERADHGIVLLDMNTHGGRVDAAVMIRDSLIESKVKTIVFLNPRGISAGALISLACDVLVMRSDGSIGAATPITGGVQEKPEAADEKFTSYMRTEMAATAERRDRDPKIAEAMVDPDVAIEGLIEKGKVLTLTTELALEYGIADFEAESVEAALETLGLSHASIEEREMNWAETLARAVSHPVVSSFLMSIGFLGIIIELYQPGWGLPGTVGIAALLLFFFGHHVVNLAGLEEILLFLLGVTLLAIEIFVIPGFGVVGVAGIALMFLGAMLSLVGLDLKLSWDIGMLRQPMLIVASSMLLTVGLAALFLMVLPKTPLTRRMVLARSLRTDAGYSAHTNAKEIEIPVGSLATALTDLRPAGRIQLEQGKRLDAVSDGGYIASGSLVRIVEWRSGTAVVRERQAAADGAPGQA